MKVKVKVRNKTSLLTTLLLNGKIRLQEIPRSERLNNGLRYYVSAYRYYRRQPEGKNPLELLTEDIQSLPNGSLREVLQQYLEASNAMSARGLNKFFLIILSGMKNLNCMITGCDDVNYNKKKLNSFK